MPNISKCFWYRFVPQNISAISAGRIEHIYDLDEYDLLKHYAEVFGRGEKYHFYIFSKGGFSKALCELGNRGEVILVSLEDMYQ